MNTSASESARDPFEQLAESFVERLRQGERPSISEYIKAHPNLADDIEELFPALVEVEQLKTGGAASFVPCAKRPALSRLGDYQILGVVGEGGMGIVYEAVRESLRSRVALKIMHPRFRANARYVRRFHIEACAAASLHHTNIVSVFDYGETDGVVYYAMPFIDGQSLETVLRDVQRIRGVFQDSSLPVLRLGDRSEAWRTQFRGDAVAGPEPPDDEEEPTRLIVQGLMTGCFARQLERRDQEEPGALSPNPHPGSAAAGASGSGVHDPTERRGSSSSSLSDKTEDHYCREVARLGAQVADALSYAHQRGVLHRDIKPSNLLLDALGNVWVTDFGLAKFEEGDDLSHSRDVVGTLRYMAPERLRGVSNRGCDVYALGATLYEMLTLRLIFDASDQHALMHQIAYESPVPLRRHDRRIPQDLEIIVLKALAKDPRDRFATAHEMSEELRRFVEGRPIQSRAFPTYERLWRWCRRNPGPASLAALAAGLVLILILAATSAAYMFRNQRDQIKSAQRETQENLTRAVSAEQDLRHQLGLTQEAERKAIREKRFAKNSLGKSLLNEGVALQRSGVRGQRVFSLDRLSKAARILSEDPADAGLIPEIRDQVIAALGIADIYLGKTYPVPPDSLIDCDKNFNFFVYVDRGARQVVIRRLQDGTEVAKLPAPDVPFWYGAANFSPDGRYLRVRYAVQGEAGVTEIWHFARGVRVFSEQTRADAFAFHPDGRLFFYAPVQTGLAVWDLEARREVRRLPLDSRVPNTLLIDQENSRLVVNDLHERAIRLIDVETGRERERWTDSVGRNMMSLSSDGRLLAAGDWNGSVFVWNMKRHALQSTLTGHTNYVGHCQFAPWSHVLATSSWDGTLRFWDASLGRPLFDMKMANFLAFAPDGNGVALLVGDRKLTMGTIVRSETYQALNPEMIGNGSREQVEGGQVRCAQFSPDGQLLAIGLNDGVHLYQAKSGNHIGILQSGPCESVLFDHEGKAVISGGPWGYYRWPIRRSGPDSQTKDARREALWIGPPELLTALSPSAAMAGAQWLPDHKTLAVIDNPAAQVRLIDTSQPHPARKPYDCLFSARNHRLTTIAISPDGKWAASGGWKEWGITLWDLPARRLDRILNANDVPGNSICFVGFSPDGKKMVSSSMSAVIGYSAWEVGTWKNAPLLSEQSFGAHRAPVFTADGTVIGLCASQTQVRLLDAATGRTLVNLLNPLSLSSTPIAFSPDGAQMIAGTNTKTALLWNLKRVRGWLRTLNLDWDGGPQYPATPEPVVARLEAQVVGQVMEPDARQKMDLAEASVRLLVNPDDSDALMMRGAALAARGRDAEAIKDFARYHRLNPENKTPDQHFAFVLNRHARRRLNLKPEDSAPRETAGLARMAVAIAPNAPDYLNTLGIALCRAGQDADALQYLNKSLDLGTGVCDAQNLYFLAIAHHRLGHVQTAKRYLKRAIDWHTSHKLSTKISPSELDRFRAEAQSVLASPPAMAQVKDVLVVRCMF